MSVEEKIEEFTSDLGGQVSEDVIVMHYLERVTPSPELVIYLHGMGLDADDFRTRIGRGSDHGIALTLPGFTNTDDRETVSLPLIQHVEVLSQFIAKAHDRYPGKLISLVGFSLGADLILRLAEFWQDTPVARSSLKSVLLLDPNINHSTMNLSGVLAGADERNPMPEMKHVIESAKSTTDFAQICSYFGKIAQKDFRPIKRHATDFLEWWKPEGDYDLFANRLQTLHSLTGHVRVVFSSAYRAHVRRLAPALKGPLTSYRLTDLGHFDLIGEELLKRELTALRQYVPAASKEVTLVRQ